MTEQEAIEIIAQVPLYRYECELEKGRQSELFKALHMGMNAIEKQIPKKAIGVKKYPNAINGKCPICERKMIKTYYCPTCG